MFFGDLPQFKALFSVEVIGTVVAYTNFMTKGALIALYIFSVLFISAMARANGFGFGSKVMINGAQPENHSSTN